MRHPFDGDFVLTQGFGGNPESYAKFGMKGHNGLDYGLPSKTVVKAPHSGKVIEIAFDATGYGNYIKIENDIEGSVLAHLDSTSVGVGEQVQEGTTIGYSDNTGNSTGPHLHWGYYTFPRDRANGYAGFIDQLSLIDHAIIPQVITQPTFNDQTKIPASLLGEDQDLEIQQVRGLLLDGKRDNLEVQRLAREFEGQLVQNKDLARQLNECLKQPTQSPVNAPKTGFGRLLIQLASYF